MDNINLNELSEIQLMNTEGGISEGGRRVLEYVQGLIEYVWYYII